MGSTYHLSMSTRERLSATVESDLLAAGRAAVAAGRAESLSAWVNDALRRQLVHEQRLHAFGEFLAEYEAEQGVITEEEMTDARKHDRANARVVRGSSSR